MNERKVHIDEFFRRQMDGQAEMPPPAVWEALEKRLDEKPGRKRPFPIWWFWTIAGLILLSSAVIIAGYLNNTPKPLTTHAPSQPGGKHIAPNETGATTQQNNNINNNTINTNTNNNNIASNTKKHIKSNAYTSSQQANTRTSATNSTPAQGPAMANNTQGNIESPSATTYTNNPPAPQRFRDNLRLLSVAPFGFELPVQIPLKPAPDKISLPETTIPGDNNLSIARLPVAATEQPVIQAPVPEIASATNVPTLPASLPGFADGDNESVETEMLISAAQDTSKKKQIPVADTTKSILEETVYAVNSDKKKPLPLSAGIKLGFSRGFDPVWNANKFVFAPYLEYSLPSNFSVMLQPAFLIGKAKVGTFSNSDQVFYEIRSNSFDSIAYVSRGAIDSSVITPNPPDTVFRTYRYGQVYDSVHVGYKVTNTQQWDVEVPIMVKYKINKTFAVIAGASATYSSVLRTKEEVTRYQGLMKQHEDIHAPQTFYVTSQGQEPPQGPPRKATSNLFPYNTAPFSNYQPRQITETNNFWRYGFMIGASATFKERLMVELMLHKSGVDVNAVPDKQLQRIYTQPYLRVMVGYKLTK